MGAEKTIGVKFATQLRLADFCGKLRTYDEAINDLMDERIFENEAQFREWFEKNHDIFGFTDIKESNRSKTPDFIMMRGDEEVRVELETLSSNFIQHKHNPDDVDLVICIKHNREIPCPVISIQKYMFDTPGYTTIKISEETKKGLDDLKVHPRQSYDEVIRKLLEEGG